MLANNGDPDQMPHYMVVLVNPFLPGNPKEGYRQKLQTQNVVSIRSVHCHKTELNQKTSQKFKRLT